VLDWPSSCHTGTGVFCSMHGRGSPQIDVDPHIVLTLQRPVHAFLAADQLPWSALCVA
jgi:hypothetical protein